VINVRIARMLSLTCLTFLYGWFRREPGGSHVTRIISLGMIQSNSSWKSLTPQHHVSDTVSGPQEVNRYKGRVDAAWGYTLVLQVIDGHG
jgi:hypothetical protein